MGGYLKKKGPVREKEENLTGPGETLYTAKGRGVLVTVSKLYII